VVIRRRKKKGPELLAAWLEKNEMTLLEFSERVDCSKAMVGALKNGDSAPGLALAVRIEKVTQIPVARWVE
jgi:transcriptional regulator with XRE-family HTH domain